MWAHTTEVIILQYICVSNQHIKYILNNILYQLLEKEMATHSSVLAWRIPGTGEPGGLPSMGLHRVGHDWSNLAAAAAATYQLYLNKRK